MRPINREPLGLSIFRSLLFLSLCLLLGLLYWSSLLIEDEMKTVRLELSEIRRELRSRPMPTSVSKVPQSLASNIDASLPNLLSHDPFYEKTLPSLLPADFRPHGVRRTAMISKPDHLHPFSNWSHVSAWNRQCSVSVANNHFGRYETMAPDMAIKVEERPIQGTDRTEFWIHLRGDVYWAPLEPTLFSDNISLSSHFFERHQVTAADFKFYLDALMNPWVQLPGAVALRTYYGDIEELRVIDPLTFVVRWKVSPDSHKIRYIAKSLTGELQPLASFVYQYFADGTKIVEDDRAEETYRTHSAWAQNFNDHWAKNIIVSCGAWIFEGMSDREIRFRRNPDHYQPLAVLVDQMEVYFKGSADSIWEDFKAGKLDSYELQPDQLLEWLSYQSTDQYQTQASQGLSIHRLDYVSRSYAYIGWNAAHPLFENKEIRQALTQAIDRQRIIEQNLNGLGIEITGPFYYTSKAYNPAIVPWPYDPDEAMKLLERNGWADHRATGILEKSVGSETLPFSFSLTYYVKNPVAQSIGRYITLALKEIGIHCHLNGVDIADLSAAFDDKSFDALMLGWALGTPPEEPRQLWYSTGSKQKGSSNAVGFAHPEADRIIDQLEYEYDPKERIKLYHRFDAIIHDEAPYTFLYTPKAVFLYRDYLKNVWIPADRQDLIPGAEVGEPQSSIFWIDEFKLRA